MNATVAFRLNGKEVSLQSSVHRPLLWVLRADLGLTGSKYGCGIGLCGSCTVLLGQEPVHSCQVTLAEVAGKEVTTIEGLADGEELHPLQQAFIEQGAFQCGYCTPGMILNALGLLLRNPDPTEEQILEQMEDNLCRCGAHQRILRAIYQAAAVMRGAGR